MTRKRGGWALLLGVGLAGWGFTPVPVAAQTLGTPVYMAPYRAFTRVEIGGMVSDPGAGFALEGAYRYGVNQFDIGIRAGFLSKQQPGGDDAYFLAGADVRFRVIEHSDQFPLDGAFTGGVGGELGPDSRLYLPVGLTFGRRIELEGGLSFVPYAHPVIAPSFGPTSEVLFGFGLGVDFKVSRAVDVRVSGGIGDIEGIGIGVSWIR